MSAIVINHNRRIFSNAQEIQYRAGCNCRDGKDACPLRGKCLDKEMICKAEVKSSQGKAQYYGQTARTFKERFYGHASDLRHRSKTDSTSLSRFVWRVRNHGEDPEITWSKGKSAKPYSIGSNRCSLCISEKLAIVQE